MEMKLVDGDYVPDGETGVGFETVTGAEELLTRALFKLTARRGAFPFFPKLGSRMWMLGREKRSARQSAARQYAAEALADEDGLIVEDVSVTEEGERLWVNVTLEYNGSAERLKVEV